MVILFFLLFFLRYFPNIVQKSFFLDARPPGPAAPWEGHHWKERFPESTERLERQPGSACARRNGAIFVEKTAIRVHQKDLPLYD